MTLAYICIAALIAAALPEDQNTNTTNSDDVEYREVIGQIEAALIELNSDPEQGAVALEDALVTLREYAPELANDPAALELRTMAELSIARAQLTAGDRFAAAATIDATLEALGDVPLSSDRLGPSLGALVDERARLLDARGRARLRIECQRPCRVLIDERNLGDIETPGNARELALALGGHRVWIEALDDESEAEAPLRTQIELDTADTTTVLQFPDQAGEAPAPTLERSGAATPRGAFEASPAHRIAPRWAEITTAAAGVAALAAGAALWAIDSSCPGGADIDDPVACPELYDTRNAGIALVSAGFAASLTGGVMLVVDETRLGDRRGRELGLVWTARF